MVVMIVSVFCNFLESIASYYTIARVCELPPPPQYAINRGLAVEGLANVISGLLGCPYGTLGASSATGFISITGVGTYNTNPALCYTITLYYNISITSFSTQIHFIFLSYFVWQA